MPSSATSYEAYKRADVETASQGKLIVMMFNGAIQRAEEAKRQLEKDDKELVHNNLIRAQDIISELRGALNMKAGELADNLDRIYEYLQHLLIRANIRKNSEPIDECVELMVRIRDTWGELFEKLLKEEPVSRVPQINPHGSSVINIES